MPLDSTNRGEPKAYFYNGTTPAFTGPMSEGDFDLKELMFQQACTPHHIGGTEFFYSCAQHVIIGSCLAQEHSIDLARAYMCIAIPRHFMGSINCELMSHLPELSEIQANIGRAACVALGLNPDLWRCQEMQRVEAQVRAIEFRDLKPLTTPPSRLPAPRSEIIIAPMAPKRAYEVLVFRMNELFPELDLNLASITEDAHFGFNRV